MANVRTLSLNLLANISEFSKGLEDAGSGLKKFGKQTEKLGKKCRSPLLHLLLL